MSNQGYSPIPTNPSNPFAGSSIGQSRGPFQGSFQVPRIRISGTAPIFIHWSILILFAVYGFISYTSSAILGSFGLRILFSIFSPAFLIFSILLHELCHAFAYSKIYGMYVEGIYLYAMGGLTTALVDPNSSKKSMAIVVSIAGPLANFVLGGLLIGAFYLYDSLANDPDPSVSFIFWFLGISQIGLGIYNMIPGVPLDGSNALVGALKCCLRFNVK